jgi:capsular polysaccharide export protein
MGVTCHLIRYSSNRSVSENVHRTKEVAAGTMSIDAASAYFNGVFEQTELLHQKHPLDLVLLWNGLSIPSRAITQFAERHHVPALFFELSNLPEKIFVDAKGVNAHSRLYYDPGMLDRYPVSDADFRTWIERYTRFKKQQLIHPFSAEKNSIGNYLFLIDVIGTRFFHLPPVGEMNLSRKVGSFFAAKLTSFDYDEYDYTRKKYCLYPMQVSTDSQLLFSSAYDNFEAIDYSYEYARSHGLELIIKPHPAEGDAEVFARLRDTRKRRAIKVVHYPTYDLVNYCQHVITINSTVGLEALILQKPVTFLGETFYAALDRQRLMKYILGYLIDVEYYSDEEITSEDLSEILQRATLPKEKNLS